MGGRSDGLAFLEGTHRPEVATEDDGNGDLEDDGDSGKDGCGRRRVVRMRDRLNGSRRALGDGPVKMVAATVAKKTGEQLVKR